ncbi:MAG TPA: zinc-dependent alcohol dehydrogenase family protein [Geminicoccaceae bacterium]|jgi:NADPH:quinone reductase-like Zn-dependent oxidoreductase|nr:zinc-dependent alcohol dehydrogenase family protein [Geminicoccaceae bacterium]
MKQVQFAAFGVPHEVATCVEVPAVGAPGPDEVAIEVEAFPINPADLLTITGAYAVRPQLPATLGAECVGRIVAAGSNVRALAVGDRVINLGRDNWCQQRKVSAAQALKVTGDADVLQLAMLKVNPATALLMLRNYVPLRAGDWVIQDAANSGVGTNLIRLAKGDGIRTVNIVRRAALIEPLTAIGADAVVVDGDDLAERVRRASGDAPIRLAIDAIGGAIVLRLADCLAEGGTVVNYGLLSGEPCQLGAHHTIFKSITLTGFWLQKALTSMPRQDLEALYRDLAGRVASGALRVEVEATYPIEEIKAALAHAEREGRRGKILVTPNGPV